jgi:hypothetical protein
MTIPPAPQLPPFRITLFYGPEPLPGAPPGYRCIFNVKKRSWKAGVQVAVEVPRAQVERLRDALGLEPWITDLMSTVSEGERSDYETRARDLFVKELCSLKLALGLDAYVKQENASLPSDCLAAELERSATESGDRLKSVIVAELDL